MDITKRLFPIVTNETRKCGEILYYAQSGMTCYVLRGTHGDLLIDTGLFQIWNGLGKWLGQYDIKYVLLTHAHADHDWNAARLQKAGAEILLSEHDKDLRQNYLSQRVQPTMPKYTFRNYTQWISGSLFNSPHYDADIYIGRQDRALLRGLGFDADIIPLPGHTYGSVGVCSNGVLYCGDAFTALWKRPDITPHAVSPGLMKRSLERIVKLSPEWLACGHGLPVRFETALPVIAEYIESKTVH
ncbi:MAG: MBL fold metallo-hydrolase [Oscillospiraceae bacterium]|nr:MBL fold metallo-hydrolase [Oscillospiraceae bacterium]